MRLAAIEGLRTPDTQTVVKMTRVDDASEKKRDGTENGKGWADPKLRSNSVGHIMGWPGERGKAK